MYLTIWGSYGRYIWFLFKSRSHDLYRGQLHLEAKTGLPFVELTQPWLVQKSNVPPKFIFHFFSWALIDSPLKQSWLTTLWTCKNSSNILPYLLPKSDKKENSMKPMNQKNHFWKILWFYQNRLDRVHFVFLKKAL